jgi:hypothetical protein
VRASESSLSATADTAAHLTGVLDILESTLALADTGAAPVDDAAEDAEGAADRREEIAALVRRTGELRDDLRRLLRAGDTWEVR